MKTTIDISDSLFKAAKREGRDQGMTFKELVERSLQLFLHRKENRNPFKLKKHSFKGKGLVEGLSEGDWNEIRSRVYEGHGG